MNALLYKISRYALGALFLFSGFTKAVNPFGLSVQFVDYFTALGLDFLHPFAPLCALMLPILEMLLGVLLIVGLYRKVVAWCTLLSMSFFTLLTLWIALYSPVSDCGCFGDILIISNWATFYKNLIFMLPTAILFIGRGGDQRRNWRVVALSFLALAVLPLYCYNSLPLIDGTPYKLGVNLWEAINNGVPDETKTTLIYRDKSSGQSREFELESTEWQDSEKWEFVDSKTVVIVKGKEASIAQLPIIDSSGEDVAGDILQRSGRLAIIVSVNPIAQNQSLARQIAELRASGVEQIVLLHSTLQSVSLDGLSVYTTDNSTLKTIIQSPVGGVLLLEGGTIIDKWAL